MLYFRIKKSLAIRLFRLFYSANFKYFGKYSYVFSPLTISGEENISIGDSVNIGYKVWLAAVPHTGMKTCQLVIGNGTNVGNFNHIYATESIFIGNNVLLADKVYITDNLHDYQDISMPILSQPIKQIKCVSIGDGAWLGENVCVIGASVGKNSVIGSNSVVTKDIPDYCIAVGSPAKIIKRYDVDLKEWRPTDEYGRIK